ncbi:MAG: leucine-rich repeat domain-containing protein [Sedimentisphaerales bacterium]|nr:leucine-rich repeat domain-containing protein [Sedimentisphaerales bacterium]
MKRVLSALVLLPLLPHPARAEDPVYFADPNFQAVVEARLWIADPTPTDMLALTELICINRGIRDLTGVEYALNLETLWLRLNVFGDISPLSGLSNLRTLHLSINQISDISPLSGLSRLEYLDIHGNQISDIAPLSGLSNLHTLVLHRNQISDISPLAGLTGLRNLDIQRNQICDISPLSGLTGLQTLNLECNEIRDISALLGLTLLEHLDLRKNPLSQEAYDVHIPQLALNNPGISFEYDPCLVHCLSVSSSTGGSVTNPGEGNFICEDGESIPMRAVADPCFVFANWSGSYCTTANPTYVVMNQDQRMRANFLSTLDAIHVDDDAVDDPGPQDAAISDLHEDGTLEHPFDSIQEAIEVAADDASIIVRPGTYRKAIDLLGKRIRLLGFDPNAPNSSSLPVIDGAGAGPVISFVAGEDSNCVLAGFVITRGQANSAGAIHCRGASPIIANCLIVGNRAAFSNTAAILCVDSQASFVNCTIVDNNGGKNGAGLRLDNSQITMINSILWGNTPNEVLADSDSELLITYTDLAGGWPGEGNIDADPLFVRRGDWTDAVDSDVLLGPDDPHATWIDGDYHLQSEAGRWDSEAQVWMCDEVTSPCIDAGDPTSPVGEEPLPNGNIVNMGAFGGTAGTGKSHFHF